jgi:hypothetical protein
LIRSVTVPAISGIIEVSVLRQLQCHARFVDDLIPAFALPTQSIGRGLEIAILRHLDGYAVTINRSISALALPADAISGVQ